MRLLFVYSTAVTLLALGVMLPDASACNYSRASYGGFNYRYNFVPPVQFSAPATYYAPPPQQYSAPPVCYCPPQQYSAPPMTYADDTPQSAYAAPPPQQYSAAPPPQQYSAPPPPVQYSAPPTQYASGGGYSGGYSDGYDTFGGFSGGYSGGYSFGGYNRRRYAPFVFDDVRNFGVNTVNVNVRRRLFLGGFAVRVSRAPSRGGFFFAARRGGRPPTALYGAGVNVNVNVRQRPRLFGRR